MIRKSLLVLPFILINLQALDLKEAINIAVEKNYDIKIKKLEYKQSLDNLNLNKSNYFPSLDVAYNYNKFNKVNINQAKENATLKAQVSYNLFNGFKDMFSIKSAKLSSKSAKYYLKALKQDIILETKKRYINYLNKQNLENTYKSQYELFKSQEKDATNKYKQGLIAKNDLLQVQVNMSNAKQNLTKIKADKTLALLSLSNILGGKNLEKENIEALEKSSLNFKQYDIKDLENRSEIQALKMKIKALRKDKKAINSGYYPKVDVAFSHNRYYENLSFDEVKDRISNQNVLSLNAKWNFFSGGKTNISSKLYKKDIAKLKAKIAKLRQDINLQYQGAKLNLEVANQNQQTAKLALQQAKENFNIVNNRFKEGISSSTDLTDANYLLTQAKQRHIKAYFDKYLAIASLNRIFEIKKR